MPRQRAALRQIKPGLDESALFLYKSDRVAWIACFFATTSQQTIRASLNRMPELYFPSGCQPRASVASRVGCPVCRSRHVHNLIVLSAAEVDVPVDYLLCESCGHVWNMPKAADGSFDPIEAVRNAG